MNSGACSAVRSRLRKTCDREKICVSPAASSFFIANSGDVCSQASLDEPSRFDERRPKPVQMGLVARGNLQGGGVDFDETVRVEPPPHEARDARSRQQPAAPFRVAIAAPEWRGGGQTHGTPATPDTIRPSRLAFAAKISI